MLAEGWRKKKKKGEGCKLPAVALCGVCMLPTVAKCEIKREILYEMLYFMLCFMCSVSAPSGHSKPVDSCNIAHCRGRTFYSLFLHFFPHSPSLPHPISPRSTAPQRFSTSYRPRVLCGFGAAKIFKCGKLDGFSKLIELNTLLIGILAAAITASFGRFSV